MSADDDVDDLYGVAPEEFLVRRKELVARAKKRGDAEGAQLIGAARRPTAAAWVVNLLVRRDPTVRPRLTELAESLRSAHAAMYGPRIRALTGVQRTLVDGLVRAGLAAAGYAEAPAALRNDVTDTLLAAVADADVAARLGRLAKAERWSGFGEFGSVTTAGSASKLTLTSKSASKLALASTSEARSEQAEADMAAAKDLVASARAEAAVAQDTATVAGASLSARTVKLATARRRYEQLLETVGAAEREVNTADAERAEAERANEHAANGLAAAVSKLESAESKIAQLDAEQAALQ